MKRRNLITAIAAAAMMTLTMSMSAYAGQWQQNETGWWYDNGDGTYAHTGWYWIDGNNDGVAECYFFDQNGYMMRNAHSGDGFWVNENGAWTVDGVVQTKSMVQDTANTGEQTTGDVQLVTDNGGYNSYGCSLAALDMLHSSREENAKYQEVKVEEYNDSTGIVYANGFYVSYPKPGMSTYQFVRVSKSRKDLDNTYLFSYYVKGLSPDEAAEHLLDNGWNSGVTGRYAFSDGNYCVAKVSDDWGGIDWSRKSIELR